MTEVELSCACPYSNQQKGRLQEHIKNQHKEGTEDSQGQGDADQATSSASSQTVEKSENPQVTRSGF